MESNMTSNEPNSKADTLSPDEVMRYSRHIIMGQVGPAGQRKLKKSKVLIPCPTFSEYEKAVKFFGGKIINFKSLNFNEDLEKFLAKIPTKGIVFFCNPNNPTGEILSKKNMEKIIKTAEKK